MATFMAQGGPVAMAMFSVMNSQDATVTLYFSPAVSGFARALEDAKPCNRPSREGLCLLAGDQRCWETLFPEAP